MSIYDHPDLYAALFPPDDGLTDDVDVWIARALGGPPSSVLEVACGRGDWLRRFAARGSRVYGFDLSPVMVDAARINLSEWGGSVCVADMRRIVLNEDPFDLAINLGGSVGHLSSDLDLEAHLLSMAALLRPGGCYLLGLCVEDGVGLDSTLKVLMESDPVRVLEGFAAVRVESVFRDHTSGVERIRNIVLAKDVTGVPGPFIEEYDLRIFRSKILAEMLARSGFDVLAAYSLTEHPRSDIGLVPNAGDIALLLRRNSD